MPSPINRSFPPFDEAAARLGPFLTRRRYANGDWLFSEGEHAQQLYFLLAGKVRVQFTVYRQKTQDLHRLTQDWSKRYGCTHDTPAAGQ